MLTLRWASTIIFFFFVTYWLLKKKKGKKYTTPWAKLIFSYLAYKEDKLGMCVYNYIYVYIRSGFSHLAYKEDKLNRNSKSFNKETIKTGEIHPSSSPLTLVNANAVKARGVYASTKLRN